MKLREFDYSLPPDLIADKPVEPRDHSRLLVLNRKSGEMEHKNFYDIVGFFHKDDVLVVNNSKVFPARLIGQKELTHGKVEIFLEQEIEAGLWKCLGRGLDVGKRILFPSSPLTAVVKDRKDDIYTVLFSLSGDDFFKIIESIGQVPLPPYITKKRRDSNQFEVYDTDKDRYQTVYAQNRGSVAAPTAGLHFTQELIDRTRKKGVRVLEVTLHVGFGTFAPVKTENVFDHKMHSEYFSIKKEVLSEIIKAKQSGNRIFAVGTTTTRVLENVFGTANDIDTQPATSNLSGQTNIFIYPGYQFRCVDALITNFHLPKSTLLMLVSALAGRDNIMKAYETAIENNYRFYSYGDAMLIA